jgi:hypothetical protein
MSLEPELVATLCVVSMSEQSADRAQSLVSRNPDWDDVMQLARARNVAPAVLKSLTDSSLNGVPEAVRERASAELLAARAAIMGRVLAGNHVIEQLEKAGIATITLKGAATGITAYGDPSLRNFADLDLLVAPGGIPAARDLLVKFGLEPQYHENDEQQLLRQGHALEFMRTTLKVELHTELISKYLRVPFDLSDIWQSSRVVRCADLEMRVLSPSIEFLFLSVHGAKHEWNSFRWIADIANLSRRLTPRDSSLIAERANEMHCLRLVSLSCQLIRDACNVESGPELETIRRSFDTSEMSGQVLSRFGLGPSKQVKPSLIARTHPALAPQVFWCTARERWRDRIFSTLDLVFRRRLYSLSARQ